MPPKTLRKVRVTKWCTPKSKSRSCLELVLDDDERIDAALAQKTWTSPGLTKTTAERFVDCIVECGGAAAIIS